MRYVIVTTGGEYFTQFEIIETRAITLNDVLIGHEDIRLPKFDALRAPQAAKFDSEQDARDQMANALPRHGGPDAFKGCTVVSTED